MAAVACGLQGCGLRIAVLEKAAPDAFNPNEPHGLRVSAINAASERLLQHLDVWSAILALRASSYHGMEVWDRDSFGRIEFDQPGASVILAISLKTGRSTGRSGSARSS